MSEKESIKTSKEEIVSYWVKYQDECGLSVDWAEANERCWRCGYKRPLERAHIIPAALGGKDEPQNLVLLCKRCHADGPNVADPEIMWDWIRGYGYPFYDMFWTTMGMKEYRLIYKHSFKNALEFIIDHAKNLKNDEEIEEFIQQRLKKLNDEVSTHWGQNYWNTATYAGKYRMLIKAFGEYMGVDIKRLDEIKGEENKPWWVEDLFL
ncbi:HNH endonuclease [Blautia sp. MSJ-19]|uniref:HNH endonuclease n=1 Tax=Blautia sp. MSJ-19 TaxID=2841517 RepID=UPI001C0EFCCE|nr:HNH endonuclease [Blautia sp. MSJ-19]MBU5480014.1 HNH endonuclease [Blautia sp. MSJ-19]